MNQKNVKLSYSDIIKEKVYFLRSEIVPILIKTENSQE